MGGDFDCVVGAVSIGTRGAAATTDRSVSIGCSFSSVISIRTASFEFGLSILRRFQNRSPLLAVKVCDRLVESVEEFASVVIVPQRKTKGPSNKKCNTAFQRTMWGLFCLFANACCKRLIFGSDGLDFTVADEIGR